MFDANQIFIILAIQLILRQRTKIIWCVYIYIFVIQIQICSSTYISQGGFYDADDKKIGIQSICLEEDAAKNLGEEGTIRKFGLERLGVPLVEIATEPFEVELNEIKKIALSLGRILRSTKKVKRGLGSIRQDVNVSIKDGGGIVIEVKGVQQLDQLEKVVEYEAKRQYGILKISKKIQETNWKLYKN